MLKRFLGLALAIALFASVGHAAVAENGSGTAFNNFAAATTVDLTTFTVDAGSNQCLIAWLYTDTGVTSVTLNWDQGGTPQAMTEIISTSGQGELRGYRLIAPTTGNKTLRASWTTSAAGTLAAVNFSGADQTTCDNNADDQTLLEGGTTSSVTITSTTDGATVAAVGQFNSSVSSTTQTTVWTTTLTGGSYALGGTSNNHSFTLAGSATKIVAGIHILAVSTGVPTSRMLTGIGK